MGAIKVNKFTTQMAAAAVLASANISLAAHKVFATEEATLNTNPAQAGANAARGAGMPVELVGTDGAFSRITNTILYIVGIIAVIMLVLGGIRYILSGGDSKKVTDAKNTIMYAIIGLIIAVFSYAIVNFVIGAIGTVSN